ncbi:hypothetical protein IAQ61_009660 [Plenodomus lingam]|uniref:PAC domain-containing protein n=1 Tax=Leptosphaeria maculans (strain JN3 / isolate v23.1.3 / race Av1-4-5-6-7-8) TaxID=985895 RepID=E4ZT66_LEPMJ|nr:hypothetical protein LEMA_P119880.1 [Plenodomus lingam JN3]KAH9863383.1 hypothetical protein IAQ61_009660 [Plenodomus lingam]CBX94497.1 hypothetical protein LEMA_P119880.1 [Plenodomus lingam JN3]
MPLFRKEKRTVHGIYPSKQSSNLFKASSISISPAKKGKAGEGVQASVDSVMTPNPNGNGEPFVVDFAIMHDEPASNERRAPRTPDRSNVDPEEHWFSDDDNAAPPPPDFASRRDIHIPSRTSSSTPQAERKRIRMQRRLSCDAASFFMPSTPDPYQSRTRDGSQTPGSNIAPHTSESPRGRSIAPTTLRSSNASVMSYESSAPSFATHALVPLQQKGLADDVDRLAPLLEDDPCSFDLVSAPVDNGRKQFSLEQRSEQLFSKQHLQAIFKDTSSLLRFTSFLSAARPQSVPVLIYYLDALKALRAISYANAVAEGLDPIEGLDFTQTAARPTMNAVLEEKANKAFDVLVRDDLPAFITHVFVQVVSVSIAKRVTGALPPLLREASEGLAEVFCLSDPSRSDNPIIFASEEFHRTTQYGVSYAIGRNCRFLQGPKTNRSSVARFKQAAIEGKDHSEVFLNYRRDGSPFMNLLMIAPLLDSRGNLRYFIGAQIDVSGLVKDGTDLDAFQRMLAQQDGKEEEDPLKDEFQELSEMFNHVELDTVRKYGGSMHREQLEDGRPNSSQKPRLLIQDQSTYDVDKAEKPPPKPDGRLSGPYKHYLIVRPAPSLRILFTSPSLRVPGILQSRFLDRIGGSNRVRESLGSALADGSRGVTAKVRWLPHAVADLENSQEEGRPRWIHCTPLLGSSGAVGVWMVVLVDEKDHSQPVRRFRQAPPVSNDIRAQRLQRDNRLDGFEDDAERSDSFSSHCAFGPAVYGPTVSNGHNVARHLNVDALRRPSSPRYAPQSPVYERGSMKSASSSMKENVLQRERSADSFAI